MTTIGVISCGELGAALAQVLLARGFDVVTTLENRSQRTRDFVQKVGLREVPDLRSVARASDVVLSLVHPDAAEAVAGRYLSFCEPGLRGRIFVDLNSIAPTTIGRITERLQARAVSVVDAALVGPASLLTKSSTLYLSGEASAQVAALIGPDVRIKTLGREAGKASALKMLLGGMNKGITALFLELGLAGEAMNSLPIFLAEYRENYPAIMEFIDRMTPTYARHAKRRAEETRELEGMINSLGIDSCTVTGVRAFIEKLATIAFVPSQSSQDTIEQACKGLLVQSTPALTQAVGQEAGKPLTLLDS